MFARAAVVAGTIAVFSTFAVGPALADTATATVTTVSPAAGGPGTVVAITGTGLTGTTAVAFAGAPDVTPATVTDSEVDVAVPAGAHSGALVVRGAGGDVSGPAFTVLPSASAAASPHSVVYPAKVTVTATLSAAGIGIAGSPATLQSRSAGYSTWVTGPTAPTDSSGHVRFTARPLATMAYRVAFGATAAYGAVTTAPVTVVQHPRVSMTVPSVAPILTATRITGVVQPAQTGAVQLQRYYSRAWHLTATGALTSAGRFSFTVKLPAKGTYTYRVRRPASTHQAGNLSASGRLLAVDRTLRSGMSGPDVTVLQKRLTALHYDVGSVTGTFGFDTSHAVVAFEKVQRLNRDGVVGTAVWRALGAPRVPVLKHPIRGVSAIEVDLTRQVLYYAVDGHIARILDSSTGGGYSYVGSDGTSQLAITPTGHFSVKYKVNHWVTAKLGVLYRPAYFNYSGYAIHGEPLVPSYPASHGCVRITVPAMDRLYSKLTNGMSVWIYRS